MNYLPRPRPGAGTDRTSPLRASDSEREAAAEALREHCAQGRLSPDELSARLDRAYAWATDIEIETLFHDLPSASSRLTPPRRRGLSPLPGRLVAPAGLSAVIAIGALTDVHQLWFAFPALVLASRRHPFGRRLA